MNQVPLNLLLGHYQTGYSDIEHKVLLTSRLNSSLEIFQGGRRKTDIFPLWDEETRWTSKAHPLARGTTALPLGGHRCRSRSPLKQITNPTALWGSDGRWLQPQGLWKLACHLPTFQSFRTGHQSTALKLSTPSPAMMPLGPDAIPVPRHTQRKQSPLPNPPLDSPPLTTILITNIRVD